MWSSFVAILRKEFKHIFRDRGTLVMFFTLPVIQLSLFGFLDQNVKDLPTVIVDQDQTRYSRELIDELRATKTFGIVEVTNSSEAARELISRGTARVGVIIPPDYHDKRARRQEAKFLVLIDGSDSTVSATNTSSSDGTIARTDAGNPAATSRATRSSSLTAASSSA